MINKYNSFIHNSVLRADSFRSASRLEKDLAHWAIGFSLNSERPMPWREVEEIFTKSGYLRCYKPNNEDLKTFIRASKAAHRMESSLRVEQKVDMAAFENNPLVLRIKFYYKNDRKEFLEWKMTFGEMGRIYQASMSGQGVLGKEVMT